MDDRSMIFIYMEHLHTFRKFILAESEKGLPLKKLKENDMKEYTNIDKKVLSILADMAENIPEGTPVDEVDDYMIYQAEPFIYHSDGLDFINSFPGGWTYALEYAFDSDHSDNWLSTAVAEGNWAGVATAIYQDKGMELLQDSEILITAEKLGNDLTQEDIEQLGEELEFLAS